MNEKICISRKYNKLLNILLGIYVTLCLVLSLLYNGFFVKPKAYTSNTNSIVKLQFTCNHRESNNIELRDCELIYTFPNIGNGRAIFVDNDVLEDMFENYYNNSNTVYSGSYCLVYSPVSVGSNISAIINGNSQAISSTGDQIVVRNWLNNETSDFTSGQISNIAMSVYSNKTVTTSNYTDAFSVSPIGDLEYVDNIEDLYKYLILEDDSVVKVGDPNNNVDNSIVDNSLPVPQNVHFLDDTIDKQNGEIYNLKIGWDNPSNASFDALESDKLKVQVQVNAKTYYVDGIVNKPSNRVYNNFDTNNEFDLFNPLMKQNLNAYFSRGSENDGQIKAKYEEGFGEFLDEGYCFYQDLKLSDEYRKLGAPSQRSQLIAGTTIKIRYKYEDNVSLWVNLRLSKNPTTWTDLPLYTDTSFTDNQDNNVEVSSDASGNGFYYNSNPYSPYYNSIVYPNPNSSNKSSNSSSSSSSSSGLGNILSGIGSIFGAIGEFFSGIFSGIGELVSSIKGLFSGENDSGGFFGFFGSLFQEFPFLLTFLTLGIAITVLLRIIGR